MLITPELTEIVFSEVPQYSEEVFFEHFRLSRDTTNQIIQRFEESRYFHEQRGQYPIIPSSHQVLIYLWYMGHQTASFRDVGDRFDVTISSVEIMIWRLTSFFSNLSPEVIKWSNDAEKREIETHLSENRFPNIIAVIDGTHIKVDKPENDSDSYVNRKGYFSIQAQAVCDHRMKIIDIFDRTSPLGHNLVEKCGRYFLLGDSGYPLQNNLLTLFKDYGNLTRRQQNYNLKLRRILI